MYFKNNFYSDGLDKFVVITVATEENENLTRFKVSCDKNNIPYIILGLGDEWKSGTAENGVLLGFGGAQKIHYLRDELSKWKELDDHIVLFTDSYDVVFYENPKEILKRFRSTDSQILFSTEKTCWPNETLDKFYPSVETEYQFLNSGGFIGYANQIMKILQDDVSLEDDDQLFYTNKFLEYYKQDNQYIKLDYDRIIFQTLNMAIDDVYFDGKKCYKTSNDESICLLHANGPSWIKKYFDEVTFGKFDTHEFKKNNFDPIQKKILNTNSEIYWSIFLQHDLSDVNQVFDHVRIMDYPKEKIILELTYNRIEDLYKIEKFVQKYGSQYKKIIVNFSDQFLDSRIKSLSNANGSSEFLILMDSNHIFRNNKSIQLLISKNLNFVTPMILKEQSDWVNFNLFENHVKHTIYNYITKNEYIVDYVYGVYVIKEDSIDEVLNNLLGVNPYSDDNWDNYFCEMMKQNKFYLNLCNNNFYGSIIK